MIDVPMRNTFVINIKAPPEHILFVVCLKEETNLNLCNENIWFFFTFVKCCALLCSDFLINFFPGRNLYESNSEDGDTDFCNCYFFDD
jgi:hypothetical protein